jgi:hypothetical protein
MTNSCRDGPSWGLGSPYKNSTLWSARRLGHASRFSLKNPKMVTLPQLALFLGLPTLLSKNLAGYRLWKISIRLLPSVSTNSIQVESFRQDFKRIIYDLLRVLAQLAIEAGIVVGVHAALEGSCLNGSIKEPRRDAQCADSISSSPRGTNFVGLAFHVATTICRDARGLARHPKAVRS